MNATTADYLKLHSIVVILSFTAILGRLTDVSSLGLVFFRTLIAAMGIGLWMLYKKKPLRTNKTNFWKLVGTGAVMAAHWMCFFGSARIATVAVSLVCFSTTSFFTSLIEPYFQKKAISWFEVILGIFVVVGIGFVFTFESQYLTGIILGLIGAFLAAVFSVLNAQFTNDIEARIITFYEMLGAFLSSWLLISLVFVFAETQTFQLMPSRGDWKWLLILGIICTVFPYIELLHLLKKMTAFTLNLSLNMEPIYGIIMAYFIFGESEEMTGGFYIGAVLILITVVAHPLVGRFRRRLASISTNQ
jgi:drug/metabolite transporter (DMT)-like permease